MTAAEAFAPAKVNLTLHVTGRRDDGYHLLDSLVAFADLGDRLTLEPGGPLRLTVSGPRAEGVPVDESNLVLRAARAAGLSGGHIHLEKNLPAAAGIGGGSSDAAAMLALAGASPADAGLSLGADVPVCRLGRLARMSGIGERLAPIEGWPELPAVLVNPAVPVPTGQVFARLARTDDAPMPEALPRPATVLDAIGWLAGQRNDLEEPARHLAPQIGAALTALKLTGAGLARMSGSGATCFGLYPLRSAAEAAAREVRRARPGWWVEAVTLS